MPVLPPGTSLSQPRFHVELGYVFLVEMSEADSKPSKPSVIIATIGHVDHGKTELTSAIMTVLAKPYSGSARAYD